MSPYNNETRQCDLDVIKKVVNQYETPLYLYDRRIIEHQYQSLKNALGCFTDIFYSIKANPNIAICKELKDLGAGAEICSEYEFKAALRAGFSPDNIIFVGPAKSDSEISLCLSQGIYAIVCESLSEYLRISRLADKLNTQARVSLRINPDFSSKGALLKMGGKPSQFGIDEKTVFDNIDLIKSVSNIQLLGIHVYSGSRILNPDHVCENTQEILHLARKFASTFGIDLKMVDVGGGIGIPYHEGEDFFNLEKLSQVVIPELTKFRNDYPHTRIILESGRFLVALSGAFVSRVIDVKTSKGENFVVTDGGTNCHMAAVGIGSLIRRNFPIRTLSGKKNQTANLTKYNITGPLCTPGDLIGKEVLLDEVSEGDFIVIDRSGAYGPTASPVLFLSHGYPTEVLIAGEEIALIRKRDSEEDFFKNQIINH